MPLAARGSRAKTIALLACAALLAIYALTAWLAVRTKSPTYDEPLHELGAMTALRGDYRLEFDHPPLWKYWAALPNIREAISPEPAALWEKVLWYPPSQYPLMLHVFYHDPLSPQVDRLIARSRIMMVLLAAALGAVIGVWAFNLAGAAAALVATFLFAFDPGFLAHGPLVKNDVVIALLMTALGLVIYEQGRSPKWWRVVVAGAISGAACSCKLSGVLLPIIAVLLLIVNGFLWAEPKRLTRIAETVYSCAIMAGVAAGVIWASYGFRFSVTPDPQLRIDVSRALTALPPGQSPPLAWLLGGWMLEHHLLPEAWLNGLMLLSVESARRPSFLLGQFSDSGWRSFYLVAAAVKTPVATLAAIALACVVFVRRRAWTNVWPCACLIIPPLVYVLAAIATPATVGIRHLLPVYPYLFIGCGMVVATVWNARSARGVIWVLAIGLLIESLSTFPNYIPFFNIFAGGSRGGLRLLSDSNLDWGQDLPLLAAWQRQHPDQKLYLCYFGTADPRHYGIQYANLPGGYPLGGPPQAPDSPGVIAISATNLIGLYSTPEADVRGYYARLREAKPMDVLGGSIYLFEWPLPKTSN